MQNPKNTTSSAHGLKLGFIFCSLLLLGMLSAEAQSRAYTNRFNQIVRGGKVAVAGNTNINVGYRGAFVASNNIDVDGDATTFNSSSEYITIPSGATIIKAYLYWHSAKYNGTTLPAGFTNILFKTSDGGSYVTLTPDVTDIESDYGTHWQGIKDVTSYVKQSGNFWVANINSQPVPPTTNGYYLPYAGWSLFVVYADPNVADPYRIVLVDGFKYITSGVNTVPVSGFIVPSNTAIPVEGEMGWFVGEGNYDWGDGVTYQNPAITPLTETPISDAANPQGNVLNESRSYMGATVSNTRNPAFGPSYGRANVNTNVAFPWFDLDVLNIAPLLIRGQTAFTMRFYVYGNANNVCALPSPYWGCGDWNAPDYLYARIRTAATTSDPKSITIAQPTLNSTIAMSSGLPIFSGEGPEGAILQGIGGSLNIISLPINGELYYDFGSGPQLLTAGTTINNFSPALFTVKFTQGGSTSLSFTYGMIGSGIADEVGANYQINWAKPLPKIFETVKAVMDQGAVLVRWTMTSEKNVDHFEIEVSKDGKNFKTLAKVPSLAPGGNASESLAYQYRANGADVVAILGIPSLLLGLLLSTRKRKGRSLFFLMALVAMLLGCLKSKTPIDTSYQGKIQVRIVQVDKEGSRAISKIVFIDEQP